MSTVVDLRIHGGRANHSSNWIAIPNRIRKTLHIQSPSAFSSAISVGRFVKSVACRCWRQDAQFGSVHVLIHREYQIDSSNNGGIAIPATKRMTCIMKSIYGRGTRRVYREATRDKSKALVVLIELKAYLGPFKLNVFPILLLMMPGSTPVAA